MGVECYRLSATMFTRCDSPLGESPSAPCAAYACWEGAAVVSRYVWAVVCEVGGEFGWKEDEKQAAMS